MITFFNRIQNKLIARCYKMKRFATTWKNKR